MLSRFGTKRWRPLSDRQNRLKKYPSTGLGQCLRSAPKKMGRSSVRSLSIRGISDGSDHFYSTVPYGLKISLVEKTRFENVQFSRSNEDEMALTTTPPTRPPTRILRISSLEVIDCKAIGDEPGRGRLGLQKPASYSTTTASIRKFSICWLFATSLLSGQLKRSPYLNHRSKSSQILCSDATIDSPSKAFSCTWLSHFG
jgi:hypothetical protein